MYSAKQLPIFEVSPDHLIEPRMWHGSFNGKESTLQQLSPYVGKLKSGMVRVLLEKFTRPGDVVLDPFCGSGVVPLEALLTNRIAWANDLSVYAYTLTKAKLTVPPTLNIALQDTLFLLDVVEKQAKNVDIKDVPQWVKDFYHPDTLKEIITAFRILREKEDYFLMGCLLGILHHQRPGFLSYPSSHLVPYLRLKSYPPEKYPKLYAYRDLRSRLVAKVKRAYKRPLFPAKQKNFTHKVWQNNSMNLPIEDASVNAIISSPPYFGALDYARDNRLRLWFLGCDDWKQLDQSLTANKKVYVPQMTACIQEMERVLCPGGYCILVLGEVERDGKLDYTAEILRDISLSVTSGRLVFDFICDDIIPDERRTRRKTKTTKFERILVMHKATDSTLLIKLN